MRETDVDKIEMTLAESAFIAGFVEEHCVPHEQVVARRLDAWCERAQQAIVAAPVRWRLAAAGGVMAPLHPEAAPESPDEPVRFVFASISERPGAAWRAELSVPPKATVGTMLELRVAGLGIDAVPMGVFSVAGCKIPLQDGRGCILFDLFLSGIRKAEVALFRPDGSVEHGRLMFL